MVGSNAVSYQILLTCYEIPTFPHSYPRDEESGDHVPHDVDKAVLRD